MKSGRKRGGMGLGNESGDNGAYWILSSVSSLPVPFSDFGQLGLMQILEDPSQGRRLRERKVEINPLSSLCMYYILNPLFQSLPLTPLSHTPLAGYRYSFFDAAAPAGRGKDRTGPLHIHAIKSKKYSIC